MLLMGIHSYEEDCFIIYCFLKDWKVTRKFLHERWCDYEEGLISLAVVSVTTNTVFELLQRSERDLVERLTPNTKLKDFYAIFATLLDQDDKLHTKEGEDFCEEAGMSEILLRWLTQQKSSDGLVPSDPDHPVDYRSENVFARNQNIIFEMIREVSCLEVHRTESKIVVPAEDEWTNSIANMLVTQTIPTWLILASLTLCDIRNILKAKISKCHDEVLDQGRRASGVLQKYVESSE